MTVATWVIAGLVVGHIYLLLWHHNRKFGRALDQLIQAVELVAKHTDLFDEREVELWPYGQ